MQDSMLKRKTFSGLVWSFMDLIANRGIQFLLQIILARLLTPENLGLIGMVMIFIAIAESLIDSGFSQALIREKNPTQVDYSTIFFLNVLISMILYVLFFIFAGWISIFFEEPQLTKIIRVLSFVIIITSLGIIPRVLLIKKVDFKTIAKANVIGVLISSFITVILALYGFGVWSLVVNMIVLQFIQTFCLWFYNKWLPSLKFSIQSLRKYFKFGSKLLLSGLLDTFYNNLYSVLIGRFYSTAQLGYYTTALRVSDLASHVISSTVQRVSYPVLSSIQDDELRLKLGFQKVIKMSAFINFPLMVGLSAIAEPLFSVLFGDMWMPAVLYFQLLCFSGMLYPLHAANLNVLQVKGRSDLFLFIEVIKKVSFTLLIILSLIFKLGIVGLIGAAVINSYISMLINIRYSAKEINYTAKSQLGNLFPIFIVSLIMGGIVYLLGGVLPFGDIGILTWQVFSGIFIYIILCKLMKIEELTMLYNFICTIGILKRLATTRFSSKKI